MIVNTLTNTKKATFAILVPHPDPKFKGFPVPRGTGFFVSKEGYFITARHVLQKDNTTFYDPKKVRLIKPEIPYMDTIDNISVIDDWPEFDLILLKVDFNKNKNKRGFEGKNGFDFIEIDFNVMPEGTEVYSFGYPLPEIQILGSQQLMVGFHYFCPRTTSAIISSHYDIIGPLFGQKFPRYYVIDKALNYGNSGGPIVVQETGKVISVCVRFQPVRIPQKGDVQITIPSLYGVTSSLKNIERELREYILLFIIYYNSYIIYLAIP